ncbi:MAG TPA: hypothetical protein DC057_03250 [Spirochaetia bacterium]|nr:hypothetical protein [Spirochaetia bacterium]
MKTYKVSARDNSGVKGFVIIKANSPKEAINISKFDLILTDVLTVAYKFYSARLIKIICA